MLRFWAFLGLVGLAHCATQGMSIRSHWDGGFAGTITLAPTHTVHGWTAHLACDAPVDSLEVSFKKALSLRLFIRCCFFFKAKLYSRIFCNSKGLCRILTEEIAKK